jgi:hypothetical protein
MKRVRILFYLPLIGVLAPYFYIISAILILHTNCIYSVDPKVLSINWLYEIFLYFFCVCVFSVPITFILLFYSYIKKKALGFNRIDLTIFVVGIAALIMLHYVDPGHYLNWFFD